MSTRPFQDKLDEIQETINKHQRKCLQMNVWRSCLNCCNFVVGSPEKRIEGCGLFNNAKPPADIIVNGCRDWEADIPF